MVRRESPLKDNRDLVLIRDLFKKSFKSSEFRRFSPAELEEVNSSYM